MVNKLTRSIKRFAGILIGIFLLIFIGGYLAFSGPDSELHLYAIEAEDASAYGALIYANGEYIGTLPESGALLFNFTGKPIHIKAIKDDQMIERDIKPPLWDVWLVSFNTMRIRIS